MSAIPNPTQALNKTSNSYKPMKNTRLQLQNMIKKTQIIPKGKEYLMRACKII